MFQSCYCLGRIQGTQSCLKEGHGWGQCVCLPEKESSQKTHDGGNKEEIASIEIEWKTPRCQEDPQWMKHCTAGYGPCKTHGHWECTTDMQKLLCSASPNLTKKLSEQDICGNQYDDNCDGKIDEGCGWARSLEGHSQGTAIALGPSGIIYIAGTFENSLKLGTWKFTTPYGLFIATMTPTGDFIWAIHSNGLGKNIPKSIQFIPNRGIYIAGCFENSMTIETTTLQSKGDMDIFVLQLNTQGKLLRAVSFGGTGYDCVNGMSIDSKGRINIVGEFHDLVSFGNKHLTSSGESDAFIAQLDPLGSVNWAIRLGNSGEDYCSALVVDHSDHLYVASIFSTFANHPAPPSKVIQNTTIGKLTPEGQWIWNLPFGEYSAPSMVRRIEVHSIALDTKQNIYVGGHFNGYSIKFGTFSINSWGYSALIAKLNSRGDVLWLAHSIGAESHIYNIAVDSMDQVYATGKFGLFIDVGPTYYPKAAIFGQNILRSIGGWDILVIKLSSDGKFTGAISAGGELDFTLYHEDCGKAIIVDSNGSAYIAGSFVGKNVHFGSQSKLSTTTGIHNAFIWKLLNF